MGLHAMCSWSVFRQQPKVINSCTIMCYECPQCLFTSRCMTFGKCLILAYSVEKVAELMANFLI